MSEIMKRPGDALRAEWARTAAQFPSRRPPVDIEAEIPRRNRARLLHTTGGIGLLPTPKVTP